MGTQYPKVRTEYAHWLLLDDRTKRLHGLPVTDQEFAEAKGVSDRTLRTWKKKPDFQKLQDQLRVKRGMELLPNSTLAESRPVTHGGAKLPQAPEPVGPEDDPAVIEARAKGVDPESAEGQYLKIRTMLAHEAASGQNHQAAKLWMELYGQPFIEAERSEHIVTFGEFSDEELIADTLEMIGPQAVARWLADREVDA